MATLKDGELYCGLERHQTVVFAVTQISLLCLQCCRDFQIGKLAYNAISFYVNYIETVIFFNHARVNVMSYMHCILHQT